MPSSARMTSPSSDSTLVRCDDTASWACQGGPGVSVAGLPHLMTVRRGWFTAAKIAGTGAVGGGASWALYQERITLREGLRVLTAHSELDWVVGCIAVQCLSMVSFALLQQCLLRAGGVRLTIPWLLSIAYQANALAVSIPVIGSGMAATYSYQQFRHRRVDPVIAKAALALAGVISTVTFAAVVAAGALLSDSPPAAFSALSSAVICLLILAAAAVALRSPSGRSKLQRVSARVLGAAKRVLRRPRGDPTQIASTTVERLGLFRLRPGVVGPAFTWGMLNWVADACGLIFAVKAIGVAVPWRGILLVWSAGQGAASLSPTPGGIGVVEVAMTAAMTAAGLRPGDALAAVLLYRIVGFKFIITLAWFARRAVIADRSGSRRPRSSKRAGVRGGLRDEDPGSGPPLCPKQADFHRH
jgi:putative heme transporter